MYFYPNMSSFFLKISNFSAQWRGDAGRNGCTTTSCETVATPISISRVVEDDTIVKETIVSTGGYRNNLLHVGLVVLVLLHFNGKWGKKYCAVELEIDHLYILPVSAPQINAAASTSSTNTPTSTPT